MSRVLSALSPLRRLCLADPGEFTQRAYANGKLGLIEVKALLDLIMSEMILQRRQALRQFDGRLSRLYQGWRMDLVCGLVLSKVVIDFGDDKALLDNDNGGTSGGNVDNNDRGVGIWGTI